ENTGQDGDLLLTPGSADHWAVEGMNRKHSGILQGQNKNERSVSNLSLQDGESRMVPNTNT
ncbi:hypothetical protein P7K49_035468, partial [Saguinus oedipus]